MATLTERERVRQVLYQKGITNWSNSDIDAFIENNRDKINPSQPSPQIATPTAPQPVSPGMLAPSRALRQQPIPGQQSTPPLGTAPSEYDAFMQANKRQQRNSVADFVGNTLWSGLDSATFGVLGWMDKNDTIEDALTGGGPTTTAGSIGAGLGSLLGFLGGPVSLAKGAGRLATQGLLKGGVKDVAQNLVYTSGKSPKAFKTLQKKSKAWRNLSNEQKDQFFKPWTEQITKQIPRLRTNVQRDAFAKNFKPATEAALKEKLNEIGVRNMSKENISKIVDDIVDAVGIKAGKALPAHDLERLIANRLATTLPRLTGGVLGAKSAEIGAVVLEEAVVLAAAESVSSVVHNLRENKEWNENMGGTLMHAFGVGAAFGSFSQFIPGGKDIPILKTAAKRLQDSWKKKKPYGSYNLTKESDRELLGGWAHALWRASERNKQGAKIFTDLGMQLNGKPIKRASDIRRLIQNGLNGKGTESDKIAGAKVVRDFLQRVENNWNKNWWGEFVKEAGSDLWGSVPRMAMGSMVMNWDMNAPAGQMILRDDIPLADKVFHVAVGAFMGKRGREVQYLDAAGNRQTMEWTKRAPLGEDYKRASQFMDMLGMDNDQLIFSGILQDSYLKSKYMKVDGEHSDIVEIKRILEEEGVIVDESYEFKSTPDDNKTQQTIIRRIVKDRISPDGKKTFDTDDDATAFVQSAEGKKQINEKLFKIKSNRGKGIEGQHDVYEQLNMVSHLLLNSGDRMKSVSELSPKALYRIEKKLRNGNYESIDRLQTISDVDDIMLSANDTKMSELITTIENSVSSLYQSLTGQSPSYEGVDSKMLRFADTRIDPENLRRLTAEQQNMLAEFERAKDLLVLMGKAKVIDTRGEKLYVGDKELADLKENFERINNDLNKVVNKTENVSKEHQVSLGDSWMLDLVEGQSFFKSYRNMYEMLNDPTNSKGAWKANLKGETDAKEVHRLLSAVLKDSDGKLANSWKIEGGNKELNEKDLYMLKSLKRMMEKMNNHVPALHSGVEGLIETRPIEVTQNQLKNLKNYFSNNGINIFSYGDNVYTETFVRAVENFGIDRFIKSSTKINSDGTVSTLSGPDRAKIAYLLKEGIADYSGNILDLDVYNPFKAVVSSDLINAIQTKSFDRGYKPYVYGDFVGSNSKFNVEDLNEDLRLNIEKVLRDKGVLQANMNDEIARTFGKMMLQYQEHIKPYIKTDQGGVFTPVTRVNAVTDYSNIAELISQLDMLEMTNSKFSHDQLLEAVNDSMGSDGLSKDKKELLRSVYNKFYYGQSPSNGFIKVLNELGLYKDGKFDFNDAPEHREMSLQDRIQVAIREAELSIPGGSTEANINQRIREISDRYEKVYETDTFKSMTENQFTEKYGIFPEQMKVGMNFQGDDVIAKLIQNARLKDEDGKSVHYTQMDKEQQYQLLQDSIAMMMTKYNGMSVKRLYADEQAGAQLDVEQIVFKNPMMNFLKDFIGEHGEMTIIDPNVSTVNGPRNARSDANAMNILTTVMAQDSKGPASTKGFANGDDGLPLGRLDSNYLPLFFGDVNFAIGVPYTDAVLNKLAQQFGEYVQKIKSQYSEDSFKSIRNELEQLVNLKLESKNRKIKDAEGNDVEVKTYSYIRSTTGSNVDRQSVNLMLTHLFMDKSFGTDYWINKADQTKENGAKFAKRIRMVLNPSAKKIDPFVLDSAIKGYERLVQTNEMPEVQESLDALKALKTGVKYVQISDESPGAGKNLNKLFSTFDKIEEQMRKEGYSEDEITDWRANIKRDDVSLADSYTAVSPRMWKALKALVGSENIEGIGGIKPVITRVGDKEGVMLGKTAFVPDKRMEKFFENNQDIDMVIMGSAEKSGNPNLRTIDAKMFVDNDGNADWSAFENMRVGDEFNNLDAEDINLASVVNSTKDGTVSYQVANELSASANNSFYDWLIRPQVEAYQKDVPGYFNSRSPEDAISYGRYKLHEDGGGLDGAYQKWLGLANGIPFTQAFLPTYKSQLKKSFIDDGIISLKTKFGNQSVLSPGLDVSDLRNTLFKKAADGSNEIFTIGQVEIAHTNRKKNVEFDRLHIIEHNANGSSKDNILTWDEFKKKAKKETGITKFKEKAMPTLGNLFDTIEQLVNTKLDGKRYEIAIAGWRPPSAKPSDKVISGLKGFADKADGNQSRLNVSDLMLRIEGDFDVDKYNYWWDTPTDIINEWNGNSGKVLATPVENSVNKHTVKDFSWGNPEQVEGYNLHSSTAGKLRGTVVKTKRIIQFLNHYTSHLEKGKGFSIITGNNRLVKFDQDKLSEAEEIIARDIQNIVDSTTGYNNIAYNEKWFEKFLFGSRDLLSMDGKTKWDGLFSIYKGEEFARKGEDINTLSVKKWRQARVTDSNMRAPEMRVVRAMIMDVVSGYRHFLQLGSDVYDAGQGKKPIYDDILSYTRDYGKHMQNLNEYAKKRILKKRPQNISYNEWEKEVNAVFQNIQGKDIRPFGAFGSNIDNVDMMLPFDRAMKEISEVDRMAIDSPTQMFGKSLARFEESFSKYVNSDNKSEIISKLVGDIKKDVKVIGLLNYLDYKIKKSADAKYSALKERRQGLADYHDNVAKESQELKSELEDQLINEKGTAKNIREAAQRRIVSDIYKTRSWQGKIIAKDMEGVTKWLKDKRNQRAVSKEVSNRPVKIKGVTNHEYLDTMIWHEILGKYNDIYLDPQGLHGDNHIKFEKDLKELVSKKNQMWKNFFEDKKRGRRTRTYLDETAIHNEITALFNAKFDKWEGVGQGLGRLFLFRFMAPKKSIGEYTYFNGKLLEGFKSTSASNIKFGLRWLADPQNHTTRIGEFDVDNMFKEMAAQYNNFYKMYHGQRREVYTKDEGIINLGVFESEARAALDNITVAESMPLKDVFGNVAGDGLSGEINPMLGSVFGYNTNETVGYIMAHNPVGLESIASLKKAAHQNFLPSAFIPQDFNGGNFGMINGWSSYNKARMNNARTFLGSAANKGALYYKSLPMQRIPFEESGTRLETTENLKDQLITSIESESSVAGGC